MSKILSSFPYYGGKAKMCPLICSMLDYDSTTLYIEPFGGGCRVLLNKKRHPAEIYNDYSFGLTSFMSVMADAEKTEELVERLLMEPPSQESFNRLVIERMETEDRLNVSTNAEVMALTRECSRKYGKHQLFQEISSAVRAERYDIIIDKIKDILMCNEFVLEPLDWARYEHYEKLYRQYWKLVEEDYNTTYSNAMQDFEKEWNEIIPQKSSGYIKRQYEKQKEQYARERALNCINSYTDDILSTNENGASAGEVDTAFNIFQLYYSSRDGMGIAWSNEKNENIQSYYKAVRNLRNVSERMRDVVVTQCDARYLVSVYKIYGNVMLYLDPSYLKPEDESKNLGEVYRMSYGYEEHEELLKEITSPDTRAKILISNYDVELYNKYLYDWKKTYYNTFTGVGSKKGNRRVEVLWQNY